MELCGCKQATAHAHVQPHCVCVSTPNTPKIRIVQKKNRNDENRIRICQIIPKNPETVRKGFGRNGNRPGRSRWTWCCPRGKKFLGDTSSCEVGSSALLAGTGCIQWCTLSCLLQVPCRCAEGGVLLASSRPVRLKRGSCLPTLLSVFGVHCRRHLCGARLGSKRQGIVNKLLPLSRAGGQSG